MWNRVIAYKTIQTKLNLVKETLETAVYDVYNCGRLIYSNAKPLNEHIINVHGLKIDNKKITGFKTTDLSL